MLKINTHVEDSIIDFNIKNPLSIHSQYSHYLIKLAKRIVNEKYKINPSDTSVTFNNVTVSFVSATVSQNDKVIFKFIFPSGSAEIVVLLKSQEVIINISSDSMMSGEVYFAFKALLLTLLEIHAGYTKGKECESFVKILRSPFRQFTVIKSHERFKQDLLVKRIENIYDFLKNLPQEIDITTDIDINTDKCFVTEINDAIIFRNSIYRSQLKYIPKESTIIINSAFNVSDSLALSDEFDLLGIYKNILKITGGNDDGGKS